MPGIFTKIALICYALATLHYLLLLTSEKIKQSSVGLIATGFTVAGFIAQSGELILQTVQNGHMPFVGARSSMAFFAWAIVLAYLFVETRYKMVIFGSFALPLALLTGIYSSLLPAQIEPLISGNKGVFIAVHASTAFIGFASFSLAVCASIMYLIQERQLKSKHQGRFYYRLPSLEILDKFSYKSISIGFPIFTISALLGLIWAFSSHPTQRGLRFQEIWWIFIWLAYAILLQVRIAFGWRGRRAAYVAIAVFILACVPFVLR
ncbi:MAG: cytochrome c biogenesis protein CcsA [Candidatus Schekmanbacteria bacterium]|nr:cytochrome c biogenesis protein CcsA [Candidatus Schekmanbacteria bacterium]